MNVQMFVTIVDLALEIKYLGKLFLLLRFLKETAALRSQGFEHVLLVTGESANKVSTDYLFEGYNAT